MEGKYDENKDFYLNDNRFNEEEQAENDRRGIDNPDLNRDRDSSLDKDRDFDTEDDDDFLDDGFDDDDDSLTDDEDFDEDPQETKRNQNRTGSETNPE